ncbi:MAG: acyl-ACP desaturase [Streptococcaceae bacterium]|jgi:antitoxin component of RelBE/YafQ-DinJ toxin-antitoxin module|nr:acyl-ACP desaturase [Streptococcaceae bacterium]
MASVVKDKLYNFRTNANRIEEAKAILKSQNLDLPYVLNNIIDQIVLTKKVPVKTEDEIQAELFLKELQSELQGSFAQIEQEKTYSVDEVFSKYGV